MLIGLDFSQIRSFGHLIFHIRPLVSTLTDRHWFLHWKCHTHFSYCHPSAYLVHVAIYLFRRRVVLSSFLATQNWFQLMKEQTIHQSQCRFNCRGGNRCCSKNLKLFLLFCLLPTNTVWDFLSLCLQLWIALSMLLTLYNVNTVSIHVNKHYISQIMQMRVFFATGYCFLFII